MKLRQKELELLRTKRDFENNLPHIYLPMYNWQRKLHDSTNRVNLLTAANQIGKSSALIRRQIANCTEPERWEKLWGKGVKPSQFWYFYPDSNTVEKEIDTKWVPEWLPRGRMETDSKYGWKLGKKNGVYTSLKFNMGPIVYFQSYSKKVANVQAGSVYEVSCFPAGEYVQTPQGKKCVSQIQAGDKVLSSSGYEEVYDLKSRDAVVYEVRFSSGLQMRATAEHPFLTQRGWVDLSKLTVGEACFRPSAWINLLVLLIWCCSREDITDGSTGIVTGDVQTIGEGHVRTSIFTSLFGKRTTRSAYPKVALSTIKTLTRSIIEFPILCVLLAQSIRESAKKQSGKNVGSIRKYVKNAVQTLLHALLKRQFASVLLNVDVSTKKETVLDVLKNLILAKTPSKDFVQSIVPITGSTKVYNFAVKNSHNFFANGILTHNCDEELPMEFYDELMFRLTSTGGIFSSGFTPTLNQLFWKQCMEGNKILPSAMKMCVSMYDCLKYEDGSPSKHITIEKIKLAEEKCKNETEKQRRVFGRFVTESGRSFYAFDFDKNMVKPYPIAGWNIYASVDYGSGSDTESTSKSKKNHPAGIVLIAVRPDLRKAAIFKSWRGDHEKTTAGDIFNKYEDMTKDLRITQACYDPSAVDFGTIAARNGVNFVKAIKTRDAGEDLLNTLFKFKILDIFDDDPENMKLASELMHVMISNQRGDAKAGDDLTDATRYGCMLIPWDLSIIDDQIEAKAEARELKTRPLTEQEFQEMQIKMRRGENIDGKETKDESWRELDEEFNHWNEEYGQF